MKLNYFNYKQFKGQYLITNDFGNFAFLSPDDFNALIQRKIDEHSDAYERLRAGRFVYQESDIAFTSKNKYDIRELHGNVLTATSLHIFVVTTACNLNCAYCQANNGRSRPHSFMTIETAKKAVEIALQSPSEHLSFEFQGGEPLLNYEVIKCIVEEAERSKGNHQIEYNLVSNLTLLTDEMVEFFATHHFGISTSIDGNRIVHEANRPFIDGTSSYDKVLASVRVLRDHGICVGAIETTTRASLRYPREIVRAYLELGFDNIFIRPLTPLGKATVNWDKIGYTPDQFIAFYNEALVEVLQINLKGTYFKESHAEILLRKIQGQSVNYMELRSPCGAGIGQLAYFTDGNIFTCDEGRMLYEMGNDAFLIGNVDSSYGEIIKGSACRSVCAASILESIPNCCDCVYQPYCGTCPVVSYAQTGDLIEKAPRGYRCQIYKGILDTIFEILLEDKPEIVNILLAWSN